MEKQFVTLGTLGGGALEEMFQEAIKDVVQNINDPNTAAEAVREINIKIKMKPTESREAVTYAVSCNPILTTQKPFKSFLFVSSKKDEQGLYATDQKQLELIERKKFS